MIESLQGKFLLHAASQKRNLGFEVQWNGKPNFPANSYKSYQAILSEQWMIIINRNLLTTTDETMRLPALDNTLGFISEKITGKVRMESRVKRLYSQEQES